MSEKLVWTKEEQEKLNIMFEGWMKADHERKVGVFKELNSSVSTGGILFVGDSITEGYPIYELIDSDIVMYNRGIGGFRSSQLIIHIDTLLIDLEPSIIFLLIGTNDLCDEGVTPTDISNNIQTVCKEIQTRLPDSVTYLISVYPVNTTEPYKDMVSPRTNQDIETINEQIKQWQVDYPGVTYVDVYDLLLKDGQLNMDYSYDGLHLSIPGYRLISKVLQPYIKKSNQ